MDYCMIIATNYTLSVVDFMSKFSMWGFDYFYVWNCTVEYLTAFTLDTILKQELVKETNKSTIPCPSGLRTPFGLGWESLIVGSSVLSILKK